VTTHTAESLVVEGSAGVIGGILGMVGGGLIGGAFSTVLNCGDCVVIPIGIGIYAGGSIGAGAGVAVVGSRMGETGSARGAIEGAFAGSVIGGLFALGVEQANRGTPGTTHMHVIDGTAAIGAGGCWLGGTLLGYYLSRNHAANNIVVGSLFDFDRHLSIGIPIATTSRDGAYVSLAHGAF
jgi:hypothetical protein